MCGAGRVELEIFEAKRPVDVTEQGLAVIVLVFLVEDEMIYLEINAVLTLGQGRDVDHETPMRAPLRLLAAVSLRLHGSTINVGLILIIKAPLKL